MRKTEHHKMEYVFETIKAITKTNPKVEQIKDLPAIHYLGQSEQVIPILQEEAADMSRLTLDMLVRECYRQRLVVLFLYHHVLVIF